MSHVVHTGWRFRSGPTTDIGDVDLTEDLPLSPTEYTEEPLTDDVPRYGWVCSIGTVDGDPAEGALVGPLEGIPGLPIAAPTGLVLDGFTTGFPDLSWDEHPDASITGYKVYRDEVLIATIANPLTVTYRDETVDPVTTYDYEIKAYRGPRLSAASDSLEVETPAVVPSAPVLTGITPGDGQLSVAFDAPASDGGAAITNYEYSTNNGSSSAPRSPAATTSPIVITGLSNGVEYEVIIRAVNSVGAGANSNMLEGTPAGGGGPWDAFVQAGDGGNGSATQTATDSLPVAPTAGNLVIANYDPRNAVDGAIGVPTAGTWMLLGTVRSGVTSGRVDIWGAIVPVGQEATYQQVTFPITGTIHTVRIVEYTGTHQTLATILNDSAVASTAATGTALSTGVVTTTENDILLLSLLVLSGSSTNRAAPGFTEPAGATEANYVARISDAYQVVTATDDYSADWTWTTSRNGGAILLAIRRA